MLLGLDEARGEALPENVVAAAVEGVEGAGVLAVEVAHALREVRLGRLDEEVVVVAEQAAGVEAPSIPADHAAQLVEEDAAVVVVEEAELLVVAARGDVVPRTGSQIAAWAGHVSTVASSGACAGGARGISTELLRLRHGWPCPRAPVPGTGGV
jgi:hypothetical protein